MMGVYIELSPWSRHFFPNFTSVHIFTKSLFPIDFSYYELFGFNACYKKAKEKTRSLEKQTWSRV